MKFINGCDRTAIRALRFLAGNPRPCGGQEEFNAEHLLQIADELEASIPLKESHYPEEWGPPNARRLTCICGNPDPSHNDPKN